MKMNVGRYVIQVYRASKPRLDDIRLNQTSCFLGWNVDLNNY